MIASKWPLLLVVGEPVTHEQADEILIRTAGWHYFATNDRAFAADIERVAGEFGWPAEPSHADRGSADWSEKWAVHHAARRDWRTRMGILDLAYLGNDQIVSSWIGGPHGWCDWSGRIGCSAYNIGKWPTTEEVTADWETIAAAFPYLDLTAQVVEDEGDGEVAGWWRVHGGQVMHSDEHFKTPIAEQKDISTDVMVRMVASRGERGVSLARLESALSRVKDLREARRG